MGSASEENELVERATKLLSHGLKVNIKDGRVLVGQFHCLDKQGNLILSNACEQVESSSSQEPERYLGMVMIPPDMQTGCFVKASPDNVEELKQIIDMGKADGT
ncbi:hypothetical protein BSKO_13546 [Bryopsis sp. KO-2023]|nr:hypothetical protein BSKO_13546 [Bryopsis sp. KO-2023]